MICHRNPSGRDTLIDCQKKFHPLQSGKVERGCGHFRSVLNDLFEPRQKNCTKIHKKKHRDDRSFSSRDVYFSRDCEIFYTGKNLQEIKKSMELSELFFDDSCQSK